MQILIHELVKPWGIEQQVGLLARISRDQNQPFTIYTQEWNENMFSDLEGLVHVDPRPWKFINPDEHTLVGPYPATKWINKISVKNYSVCLSHLPWGLHPREQTRWLGTMQTYVSGKGQLFKESLRYLAKSPVRWITGRYNRWRHRQGIDGAETLYAFDHRLEKPIQEIYGHSPELLIPSYPSGRTRPQPQGYYLAISPLEPERNLHAVIDAFYLLVRRYGARFQANWESDVPFQSGDLHDFQLKIIGTGPGKSYLEDYARSQQLGEKTEFLGWPAPEQLQRYLEGAIGVIDVPLTGDASNVPYRALAEGIPAVYTRSHPGIDSLIGSSKMARQVKPSDRDAIARAMIEFAEIPPEQRKPNETLKKAIDPKNQREELLA